MLPPFHPRPPHPDTLRAWGTFWQSLRFLFARAGQQLRSTWQQWEQRFQSLCGWVLQHKPRLALILLTLLWLLPGTAQLPLIDRDEPRFAFATQEMLDRHDYWQPTFNEEPRFDKPPLVYWWMRAHYLLFGFNEFSARLHSVVATVFCVLLIFGFAARLYNRQTGFLSALAFLTALQVFLHGRLCVADMPMMVFIIAAQWAAWELLQKPSWRWATVFWASLALGFTTKWLVPWAALGVGMTAFFILKKRWPPVKNFKPLFGLGLMAAFILGWAIPAWIETNGEFFRVGIGEHFFERGLQAFNARGYNPLIYIFSSLFSLLPWLGLAGAAFVFARRQFDDRAKFLLSWTAGIYLLFSLARTQLPHYVLPAFPSLFILIAAATQLGRPTGLWSLRFYRFTGILWTVALLLAFAITLFLPATGDTLRLKLAVLAALLSLLCLTLFGGRVARRQFLGSAVLFIAVPILFGVSSSLLQGLTPADKVAHFIDPTNPPIVRIATGFEEPSLVSTTQLSWHMQPHYAAACAEYNGASNAALVVLAEEFSLESIPSILLKQPLRARRDNQKELMQNPPIGGRRFHFEGVHLGRFSWVRGELYLKP